MNEEIAHATWKETLKLVYQVLSYQLFELDGHGVSLGKLMSGIVLLTLGYMISKRGAKEVDKRILTRMSVDESLRYTLRKFIFYFFLCLSTLFTLHTLNVPVTIFTVLGGALAVGIGFGSQNLVNNFISGILVMMERPIRVGDYIELEGIGGQVVSIGIRSTIVRTSLNAVTMIPNTTFIEKNLTNWTMSGTIYCTIRIGVAYGTDTKRLSSLCIELLGGMDLVVKFPAPELAFIDFGDSALLFDLGFHIESSSFPIRRGILSDIRYKLNDLFNQNKIEIPFPQRDLRIRDGGAVPVKVQNNER